MCGSAGYVGADVLQTGQDQIVSGLIRERDMVILSPAFMPAIFMQLLPGIMLTFQQNCVRV